MKLFRVEIETELYCLAESQAEAEKIGRHHSREEEVYVSAYVADYVEGDWQDVPPYHDRGDDLPDKTCMEWLRELNEVASAESGK